MKNLFVRLEKSQQEIIRRIGTLAAKEKVRSYVVGGYVRDLLIHRPTADLDIVVEGDAVSLAQTFAQRVTCALTVYHVFGTATVKLTNGQLIDFASARKESYPSPGALPVVSRGSIHDDLFRRDITINAIAIAVNAQGFGELIDGYNGCQDLQKKSVRVLHSKSFIDDPTRILRAVRFEQRFGFALEAATLRWLKIAIKHNAPTTVKPQRYFEEFKKNLKEDDVAKNLHRLAALSALKFLPTALRWGKSQDDLAVAVGKNIRWAQKHLPDWNSEYRWVVFVMLLLKDVASTKVEKVLAAWAVAGSDRKKIMAALNSKDALKKISSPPATASEIFELLKTQSLEGVLFFRSQASVTLARRRIDRYLNHWRHVRLFIDGHDLHKSGIPQGRIYKNILDYVLVNSIDEKKTSKARQLSLALDFYRQSQAKR